MQELSVSALVSYLKQKLESDNNLQRIYVQGEISNYRRQASGHLYFSLKDDYSSIKCVMFKSSTSSLTFEPKNGDKVILYANTSIYDVSGELQLYVFKITLSGLGDLYAKYEALKNKLAKEGKFDNNHKIELSKYYIEKAAVLVGDNSAAMADIKTTFSRRWPLCNVDYYPVTVQGSSAASEISNKLIEVDKLNYDAIILARGGGSFEDLFCFNDENLVNTIYNLNTFIVTGVGHDVDTTLVDYVSDLRAPTPTAAVELITPKMSDVIQLIKDYEYTINLSINNKLDKQRMNYDYYNNRLLNYQNYLNNYNTIIDNHINNIKQNILHKNELYKQDINQLLNNIKYKVNLIYNNNQLSLKRYTTLLDAYSSQNTLKRGYTLVLQDNKLIKKKKDLKDKEFEIKFADGTLLAERK